ncbi:MAG: UbiD family decarboxylase [Dehalococcoidia bacterium]|nr:UbiD family decarboxylase [Dehalococcoidia bacterium]
MAFLDLRQYLDALEGAGELHRVKAPVSWDCEIGAVAEEAIRKRAGALLFENIEDYRETHGRKLLINTTESPRRVAIAFGLPPDTSLMDIIRTCKEREKTLIKPRVVAAGPCKEVVHKEGDINLLEFPAPKLHAQDGGRYLQTFGGVVTRDPESDWMNVAIYRGMVHDSTSMGFLWVPTQHWGIHGRKYRALGKPMPMAVTMGAGALAPLTFYAHVPVGVCEYDLMGAFAQEPVELVKCETSDLLVPASSEIVLEGEMSFDPSTFRQEGPFGEYPGYYTSVWSEPRPVFKVKCITHRKDPILQCQTPGMYIHEPIPHMTLISSAQVWNRLEASGIEGITGVYIEPAQPAVIYIALDTRYYGHARQVAAAVWSLGMNYTGKYVIVTDSDVDITNAAKVMAAVANRTQASRDLVVFPGLHGGPLDPSTDPEVKRLTGGVGSWDCVLIDATWPWDWEPREEWGGLRHPPACQADPDLAERVRQRWQSYGF